MSIKLMTSVWELDLPHGQQSVLLILTDHANDEGQRCYPSVPLIAWKSGYTENHVRKIMSDLRRSGIIVAVANEQGGRGKAVEYHIHLEKATKKIPFSPPDETPSSEKPYHHGAETLSPRRETLSPRRETPSPVIGEPLGTTKEPSINHYCADAQKNRGDDDNRNNTVPPNVAAPDDEEDSAPAPPQKHSTPRAHGPPHPSAESSPPPEITEEFRAMMREKYPGLDVDAEIGAALNHKAVKKAINKTRYVDNWLRRAEEWRKERQDRPKPTARAPARRPEINADPETYSFFGGR